MQANRSFMADYRLKAIVTGAFILLILAYHLMSGTLFYGMGHPPFLFAEKETFYQLFSASYISQVITSNTGIAIACDISLFALPVVFALTGKRGSMITFSILALIYFLTFNMVTGHHYHGLVGLILITIPFWFKREEKFNISWEMVRYYFLYVFSSAALWKIFRGTAFYPEQLTSILKAQQLDLLLQHTGSIRANVITYFIAHSSASHAVLIADVALQLIFVVGFFTKRYDSALFWLAIIFCVANYFVMNVISAELLILDLTLLNWNSASLLKLRAFIPQQMIENS